MLLIHGLAAAGVVLSGLSGWFALPVLFLLAVSLLYGLLRHVFLRTAASVTRFHARPDGLVDCLRRDGEWRKMQLLPGSSLFPLFAVLCLEPEGGGRGCRLTLFHDALPAEDWRRFCVWLRWAAAEKRRPA